MENNSVVVLLSGGLDSTAVIGYLRSINLPVNAISFVYGQNTADKEIKSSRQVCNYYRVENHQIIDLGFMQKFLSSGLVEKDTILTSENKLKMYVPFRNSIFLSFAVAYAESLGAAEVAIGSHLTGPICPDNSPEYLQAFQQVIELGTMKKPPIRINAPFANMNKVQLIQTAIDLKVPFELTWSCFNDGDYPCGICPNCIDRLRSFKACGYTDPLRYMNS